MQFRAQHRDGAGSKQHMVNPATDRARGEHHYFDSSEDDLPDIKTPASCFNDALRAISQADLPAGTPVLFVQAQPITHSVHVVYPSCGLQQAPSLHLSVKDGTVQTQVEPPRPEPKELEPSTAFVQLSFQRILEDLCSQPAVLDIVQEYFFAATAGGDQADGSGRCQLFWQSLLTLADGHVIHPWTASMLLHWAQDNYPPLPESLPSAMYSVRSVNDAIGSTAGSLPPAMTDTAGRATSNIRKPAIAPTVIADIAPSALLPPSICQQEPCKPGDSSIVPDMTMQVSTNKYKPMCPPKAPEAQTTAPSAEPQGPKRRRTTSSSGVSLNTWPQIADADMVGKERAIYTDNIDMSPTRRPSSPSTSDVSLDAWPQATSSDGNDTAAPTCMELISAQGDSDKPAPMQAQTTLPKLPSSDVIVYIAPSNNAALHKAMHADTTPKDYVCTDAAPDLAPVLTIAPLDTSSAHQTAMTMTTIKDATCKHVTTTENPTAVTYVFQIPVPPKPSEYVDNAPCMVPTSEPDYLQPTHAVSTTTPLYDSQVPVPTVTPQAFKQAWSQHKLPSRAQRNQGLHQRNFPVQAMPNASAITTQCMPRDPRLHHNVPSMPPAMPCVTMIPSSQAAAPLPAGLDLPALQAALAMAQTTMQPGSMHQVATFNAQSNAIFNPTLFNATFIHAMQQSTPSLAPVQAAWPGVQATWVAPAPLTNMQAMQLRTKEKTAPVAEVKSLGKQVTAKLNDWHAKRAAAASGSDDAESAAGHGDLSTTETMAVWKGIWHAVGLDLYQHARDGKVAEFLKDHWTKVSRVRPEDPKLRLTALNLCLKHHRLDVDTAVKVWHDYFNFFYRLMYEQPRVQTHRLGRQPLRTELRSSPRITAGPATGAKRRRGDIAASAVPAPAQTSPFSALLDIADVHCASLGNQAETMGQFDSW